MDVTDIEIFARDRAQFAKITLIILERRQRASFHSLLLMRSNEASIRFVSHDKKNKFESSIFIKESVFISIPRGIKIAVL